MVALPSAELGILVLATQCEWAPGLRRGRTAGEQPPEEAIPQGFMSLASVRDRHRATNSEQEPASRPGDQSTSGQQAVHPGSIQEHPGSIQEHPLTIIKNRNATMVFAPFRI